MGSQGCQGQSGQWMEVFSHVFARPKQKKGPVIRTLLRYSLSDFAD